MPDWLGLGERLQGGPPPPASGLGDRLQMLQDWWNRFNQPQQPLSREEINRRGQELPFDEQVAALAASQIPPRELPQSPDDTTTGAIGAMLHRAPFVGPLALGLGSRLGAAGRALTGKQGYSQALEDIQTQQEDFRRLNPEIARSAENAGSLLFSPAFGSRMGAQVVGNAALAGADAMVRGEDATLPAVAGGAVAGALHLPAIFGGVMARTANHEMLALAKKMKAEGVDRDTIWKETGWDLQHPDKMERFEISDEASKFVPPTRKEPPNRIELAQQRFTEQTGLDPIKFATPKWSAETSEALKWVDANMERLKAEAPMDPLGDILHHPDLYAAYPEMANIPTQPERLLGGPYAGSWNGETMTYGGGGRIGTFTDPRSTILHEGGHVVQGIEGFGRGANTFGLKPNTPAWDIYKEITKKVRTPITREEFAASGHAGPEYPYETYLKQHKKSLKEHGRELDVESQKTAVRLAYERASGEVESRNIQKRMNMTAEERRATPPWKTQDVPDEQQIVRFGGLGDQLQAARDPRFFSPYSGIKHDRPVEEITATYGQAPPSEQLLPKKEFDFNTVQPGDYLVSLYGDRTRGGETLTGVNGITYENPVTLQAGSDFLRRANNPDKAFWGTGAGGITTLVNRIRPLQNEGNVFAAHAAMGAESGDFSSMTAKAIAEHIDAMPLSDTARARLYGRINKRMKEDWGKDFPAVRDWPGFNNMTDEYLVGRGAAGKKLAKLLDTREFRDLGAPDIGAIRMALVNPDLRNARIFDTGDAVARIGPEPVQAIHNPQNPHFDYPSQAAGGEYVGSSKKPIPGELAWPDFFERNKGMSPSNLPYTYQRQGPIIQRLTRQQIDTVLEYLNSDTGRKLGMAGAVAAGLLSAEDAAELFGSDGARPPVSG